MKSRVLGTIAPLLVAMACIRGSAQVTRNVVQVTRPGPVVTLREVLHIGSLDGPHDGFGQIADVALDRNGRVYVADDANHRVAVFGRDGAFVANVGREGAGPGEFRNPWLVRVDPHDSVFVWDITLARISVFDPQLRYVRGFRTPPQWMVNGIAFLPDGRLVIAAFGSGERSPLHLFDRAGSRLGSFGPALRPDGLGGFERSLLGGDVAIDGRTLVYSNKSPYQVDFYDFAGRLKGRCVGRAGWTTPPADVVVESGGAQSLRWNRYVHATHVIALGGGLYLNVIHDPRTRRDSFDLLTSDCRLVRRTALDEPVIVLARSLTRVAAVRSLDYPEVVVYEMAVAPR